MCMFGYPLFWYHISKIQTLFCIYNLCTMRFYVQFTEHNPIKILSIQLYLSLFHLLLSHWTSTTANKEDNACHIKVYEYCELTNVFLYCTAQSNVKNFVDKNVFQKCICSVFLFEAVKRLKITMRMCGKNYKCFANNWKST